METKKQSKNFLLLYVIKKLKNSHFGSAARQSPEDVICRVIGSQYLQTAKYLLVGQEAYQGQGHCCSIVVPLLKTPTVILFLCLL